MTWSTGLWLAVGFPKLHRAQWSACQPLGQHWDETDKIIVSNETQISVYVWTRTNRPPHPLEYTPSKAGLGRGVFHIDLEFEERCCKSVGNSNQSPCTSLWSFDTVWSSASEHGSISLPDPVVMTTLIIFLYGPVFYTGKEPLCSLGICISLGQVLKVREMNQNKSTREQSSEVGRKGDSLKHIQSFGKISFFFGGETFLELLTVTWVSKDSRKDPALCRLQKNISKLEGVAFFTMFIIPINTSVTLSMLEVIN